MADDYEAFMRDKEMLLREMNGRFVAYANGRFLCDDATHAGVLDKFRRHFDYLAVQDIFVERVDEHAFEPKIAYTSEMDATTKAKLAVF